MECRNKIALINDCTITPLTSQSGSYDKLCKSQGPRNGIELGVTCLGVCSYGALKAPLSSLLYRHNRSKILFQNVFTICVIVVTAPLSQQVSCSSQIYMYVASFLTEQVLTVTDLAADTPSPVDQR